MTFFTLEICWCFYCQVAILTSLCEMKLDSCTMDLGLLLKFHNYYYTDVNVES